MGDRRQARELALQALFFLDMEQLGSGKKSDLTIDQNIEAFCSNNEEELTKSVKPFFDTLIHGVMEHKARIDDLLNQCSKNWKISRMPVVDRNIMRIATYEFLECDDIPDSVTINEAVEIGKKFGSKDSGAFINGVLDQIKSLENSK
ncbi:MAG: transcription antitermination factor NusB [Pseudomonadota bacterium]